MGEVPIRVDGIPEVAKALRAVDKGLVKLLRDGMKEAAEIAATEIRTRVPKRSGRAAASVKAKGTNKGGGITFGGTKAPYYPWLDFGGSVGKGHQAGKAFSGAVKRPIIDGGRYVYPGVAATQDEVREKVDELLADLIRRHDLPTSGNGTP
jgi:hypothetical protein